MKKLLIVACALLTLASVPLLAQTNPATSTTLSAIVADGAVTRVSVTSAAGLTAGASGIYVDGEYMTVSAISGTVLTVQRGQLGTVGRAHVSGATVIKGPVGMFTTADAGPGACPSSPQQYLVSVNTVNGNVWFCQNGTAGTRYWRGTNTRMLTYNSLTIA